MNPLDAETEPELDDAYRKAMAPNVSRYDEDEWPTEPPAGRQRHARGLTLADPDAPTTPAQPPTPDEVIEQLTAFGPNINGARRQARQIAKLVAEAEVDQVALGDWRDLLKSYGHLPAGEFGAIVKQVTDQLKQEREAREAAQRAAAHAANLTAAIAQGAILPSPANPLAVARVLMEREPCTDGRFHRAWWRDDFYRWAGSRWVIDPTPSVRRWIYRAAEHAEYDAGDVRGIQPWQPDRDKVNKVVDALGTAILQRPADAEAEHAIACANGVYDLATGQLLPHSPARFNLISLPYAYDPAAACPLWCRFLDEALPVREGVPPERQGQQFLREWFGYCISGRNDLEKMASLVGAPRSGKGTAARVLRALLGADNVVAPTLRTMAGPFGEESFIGKSLATLGDVRWNTRDAADTIDIFLAITGEDAHDVQRKNRTAWHGTLGLRFMVMSNDPPTFNDASGALSIRMIQLAFEQSFVGREDSGLTGKLLEELPGIFNWALAGLRDLTARGRFAEPACGADLTEQVRRLSSPEYAFIDDTCTLAETAEIALDELHKEYQRWCAREGKDHVATREAFSKNVQSAYRGKVKSVRRGDPKITYIRGLSLARTWSSSPGPTSESLTEPPQQLPPVPLDPPEPLFDELVTCDGCGFGYDSQGHAANCERGRA